MSISHQLGICASACAIGALLAAAASPTPALAASPTGSTAVASVDPFIGTQENLDDTGKGNASYGNTMPGATLPFGMIQSSPTTYASTIVNDDIKHTRGGYEYTADQIRGFGLDRLSGTGCSGRFSGYDFPIMPYAGSLVAPESVTDEGPSAHAAVETPTELSILPSSPADDITAYYQGFSHDKEQAEPGYYSVTEDSGVTAELTATTRSAVSRFTFPSDSGSSTLILDAAGSNNDVSAADITIDPTTNTVSGTVTSKIVCASGPEYTAHFWATFDHPFMSWGTWSGSDLNAGSTSATSTTQKDGSGAWIRFDRGTQVTAHVGLSFVDVDGAAANVTAESGGLGFDQVRSQAHQTWEETLASISTEGGTDEQNTKFFTALYHALGNPNTFDDADGRYRGYDDVVRTVEPGHHFYVNFSGWDTYRGQAQLVALVEPQVASDINQSIVDMVDQSGTWSSWPSYNRTQTKMSGDSLQVIVASTDAFGSTDYDRQHALDTMVSSQSLPGAATQSNRSDAFQYSALGWVDGDTKNAATSRTLEYTADDFAIAQLAQRLGDDDAHTLFSQRSQNWMNVFNFRSHHVDARNRHGFMDTAMNTQGDQFEQSTGNQYGFSVPYNMAGLIQARGGIETARTELDRMLTDLDAGAFSENAYLTNQPSFGLPWAYNWLRDPSATTDTLSRAVTELYSATPGGLHGNDDLGALSAWYVWANLGLYPGIYGTSNLLVSAPMFDHITISSIGTDRVITLNSPEVSSGAKYTTGLSVNGTAHTASWLPESFTREGGTLDFTMSDVPGTWGTGENDVPPSFAEGTDDRNGRGVTSDGEFNGGSMDVGGTTLSREQLAEQGITPGAQIPLGDTGVTFTWPDTEPGQPDHYIPHGQRLGVDNVSTSGISFLGLSTDGPSVGTATVEYTDGTTQEVTLDVSDWVPGTIEPGNTIVARLSKRNKADGTSDDKAPAVFATQIVDLDPSKTVEAVVLPTIVTGKDASTADGGIMHIFSVGFRDATTPDDSVSPSPE